MESPPLPHCAGLLASLSAAHHCHEQLSTSGNEEQSPQQVTDYDTCVCVNHKHCGPSLFRCGYCNLCSLCALVLHLFTAAGSVSFYLHTYNVCYQSLALVILAVFQLLIIKGKKMSVNYRSVGVLLIVITVLAMLISVVYAYGTMDEILSRYANHMDINLAVSHHNSVV